MLIFWGLDGYLLWQERLFRALYDRVRLLEEREIDFSMDVSPFQADPMRTWLGATFSKALIGSYGALVAMVGLAIVIH